MKCHLCEHSIIPEVWGGAECANCGSVSVTALPTEEDLAKYYLKFNDTYTGGGQSGGKNQIRYANKYLKILKHHLKNGKVIDLGSSTNPFPNLIDNAGFNVSIMDYVRPKMLNPNITFYGGNLNDERDCPAEINAYDAVTSWAVIEHVRDPQKAVKLLTALCKPGGLIFLSTPEIGTFLTQHSIGRSPWFCPPQHLHLISPTAIKNGFALHDCILIKWGRLELNTLRWTVRYGVGLIEALVGIVLKYAMPSYWKKLRVTKTHRFQGIAYFVLRKKKL